MAAVLTRTAAREKRDAEEESMLIKMYETFFPLLAEPRGLGGAEASVNKNATCEGAKNIQWVKN